MTPEEKVSNLYIQYTKKLSYLPYDEYDPEILQVIQQVVSILGHKIKGINC